MPTRSFTEVIAWQKAHTFVRSVYLHTASFPPHERFGLTSQFQRAAVSIAANIAEGYKKKTPADKLRFLNIAQGSLEECRCYIILAKDIEYINNNIHNELNTSIEEASKVLNAYYASVENSQQG